MSQIHSVNWHIGTPGGRCLHGDCIKNGKDSGEGSFCLACYLSLPECKKCGKKAITKLFEDGVPYHLCRNCMNPDIGVHSYPWANSMISLCEDSAVKGPITMLQGRKKKKRYPNLENVKSAIKTKGLRYNA